MLLESVNMVTAIHHTFAMLSYFLLTSKVLKDLNRVIISERQLRKYGAPQQSLQQDVFLHDQKFDFSCVRNMFLERSFLVSTRKARLEILMEKSEYQIKLHAQVCVRATNK